MASTAYINQSKQVEEISKLFGEGRLCKKYEDHWLDNYEWVVSAEEVRSILGHFGMATYKDLEKAMLTAPIEDVKGCYDSMMLAGGSRGRFYSTYPDLISAMQVMCARLGVATSFVSSVTRENSTKPLYALGIKKTDGAYFSEMKVNNIPPQDVWCPTTENGTWVMKEDNFVTITSNCCTSATGRALAYCGIGIDTSVASYEEVEGAIEQQELMELATDRDKKNFMALCKKLKVDFKAIRRQAGQNDPSAPMTVEEHGRCLIILKDIEESREA